MCGIAGFYQTHFDYTASKEAQYKWNKTLHSMKTSLNHRGPDENNIRLYPHAGLAHTRLSIIDLANGQQPMSKRNQERDCTIVYNGEIYNTTELREILTYYDLYWDTSSDTEVILNGYLAMGTHFFSLLNGIFSFAIYDEGEDSLYIVRDRLGVKPLFYQKEGETFVFGSEPKALFSYGIVPKLNTESFGEILGLGPAHTPGHGVFAGMKEVLPGHFLCVKGSMIQDYCYWQLIATPHEDSYSETVEHVSWLIEDSICRQMTSDIPICTFLSGGLDSSLVSAFCQKHLQKEGSCLTTYSFDFIDNDINFRPNSFQTSQERPFVDIMKNHLRTNHIYLECDNQTQADYLYRAVDARDLPCMADIESSLLYFCEQVAKHHKVALTGECADEIFGGYPWFHCEAMWRQNLFPWSSDLSPRLSLLRDEFLKEHDIAGYVRNAYECSLAETPRLIGENETESRRREISWLNLKWFMATLLNRMDRTSMASGLEARVPFADHRIVQYVYNIPWDMKCHNGKTKSLLLEAGKTLLPEEVLYRKKSPYPKTYDPAYENLLKERLLTVLANPNASLHNIVDTQKVKTFLNSPADYGKPWYGQLMAGPQMSAYLLQLNYWLEKYSLI